jgi:hypothetical protein
MRVFLDASRHFAFTHVVFVSKTQILTNLWGGGGEFFYVQTVTIVSGSKNSKGDPFTDWLQYRKYVLIARVRVARFTRAIPQSASPASHALLVTKGLSKFHHGTKLWVSQNIFPYSIHNVLSKYCHILGKTLGSGPRRRPGRQAWGHKHSSSAPCALPMRLSRTDQHIKDEPCAK